MTYVRGVMVPGVSLDGTAGPVVAWSSLWNIRIFYHLLTQLPLKSHATTVWAQVPLNPYSVQFLLAFFFPYFSISFHS